MIQSIFGFFKKQYLYLHKFAIILQPLHNYKLFHREPMNLHLINESSHDGLVASVPLCAIFLAKFLAPQQG